MIIPPHKRTPNPRVFLGIVLFIGAITTLGTTSAKYLQPFPELLGEHHKSLVEIDAYIDSSEYFFYYYCFNSMSRGLQLDGIFYNIQSLTKLNARSAAENLNKLANPKIYLVIIFERNLERYQEALDILSARQNLVLWVMSSQESKPKLPSDFVLDAIISTPNESHLFQDFLAQVLPRIFSIYNLIL